jgi:hypothetical protein
VEVSCGYCRKCVVILCYGTINVFPSVFVRQMGIDPGLINETTIFVLGQAAALMFGWTFLLIWADRDPVKRRKVLLLTIFVIGGMLFTSEYIMCIGFVHVSRMIGLVVWQVILLVTFAAGYVTAGNLGNT